MNLSVNGKSRDPSSFTGTYVPKLWALYYFHFGAMALLDQWKPRHMCNNWNEA